MKKAVLFFKSHIETYTRRDGTVVTAHDDKRKAKSKAKAPAEKQDYASNLAMFLQEKKGSIFGRWSGKMTADEQRKLFGRYIGKGTIVIDGQNETVHNQVSVGFGQDWDDRNITAWRDLQRPT